MKKSTNLTYLLLIFIVLAAITLLTTYQGSADIRDYSDTAKFFAGEYSAKIRNTHSYIYGFALSPLVRLTKSFIIFKIINLISLALIAYSIYIISNKNKETLWLFSLSPIVWYMAPWISPIIVSSLFLLWAYHFINKYDKTDKITFLVLSGLFVGLGWAIWDTILYFGVILFVSFMLNKKFHSSIVFSIAVLIGLSPRLIFDQLVFNFAFLTSIKTFTAGVFYSFFGNIYGNRAISEISLIDYAVLFLTIPISFWTLYKKNNLLENKKTAIFITLSLLLIMLNPQPRYVMALAPITILISSKVCKNSLRKTILFSAIISLLFITPYIIQIDYNIDPDNYATEVEFNYLIKNLNSITSSKHYPENLIIQDLNAIAKDHPRETFLVFPQQDTYQLLAHLYWGDQINEFVSTQDYNLWKTGDSTIFEKKFIPKSNIQNRRQIWIAGGIDKNPNDQTDYGAIHLAISLDQPINNPDFNLLKKYQIIYLYSK